MPAIRPATPDDADALARLHVACWRETYAGLLPAAEIARRDAAFRLRQWRAQIAAGTSRIRLLPGLGFAQTGPQRDPALADAGYPTELYCLYLLRAGQGRGHGRALLASVRPPGPMTALVLDGNARACAFYAASGARRLRTLPCHVGDTATREHVFAWPGGPLDDTLPADA